MKQFRLSPGLWPHLLFALTALLCFAIFVPRTAHAACTSPAAVEGKMTYNQDYHTFQFCNGTYWIPMCAGCATTTEDTAFITGELLGTFRSDSTNAVGFQFVVGASNITVTQLGRWVISGNSQIHSLAIFDSSCALLASVLVNTSGAPAGQFLYGTLSSPITLTAGGSYYVMTAENTSDQWYNGDTSISTTSAGTVQNDAYNYSGPCQYGLEGAGHSYGLINFKYH